MKPLPRMLCVLGMLLTYSSVSYGQYLGAIRGVQRGLFHSSSQGVYTHRNPVHKDRSGYLPATAGETFIYILNGKSTTNTRRVGRILSRDNVFIEDMSFQQAPAGGRQRVLINYRRN